MLKYLRIVVAVFFFACITYLFLDFRNTGTEWYDWVRYTQIIPAIFATSAVSVVVLLLLTLIFGRVYCSVLCPLGILQDFMERFYGLFLKKRRRNNRFTYSPAHPWFRYIVFCAFFVAMIIGIYYVSVRAWAALIEPYSAYGRIAQALFSPFYDFGNNILADWAVKNESTTFWHVVPQQFEGPVFWIAAVTFAILFICVVSGGRIWCNTVCPAGTLLGFLSRFSILAPVIKKSKCVACRKCERNCKSQCIDIGRKSIDYSRCVTCFNCIGQCKYSALKYSLHYKKQEDTQSETAKQ